MTRTKLLKSAGRFGARYGVSVKRKIAEIEGKQRKKQICIFCNGKAKRLSKGIWGCNKCKRKFAGHAYYLLQEISNQGNTKKEEIPSKPLKKEAAIKNKVNKLKEGKLKTEENKKSSKKDK